VLQYSDCMGLLAMYCCFYGDSDFDSVAPDWIEQHSGQLRAEVIKYSKQHGQNPVPGILIGLLGKGHVA